MIKYNRNNDYSRDVMSSHTSSFEFPKRGLKRRIIGQSGTFIRARVYLRGEWEASMKEFGCRKKGEMVIWARDDFRGGASLILLKVVKRRARNYSFETRFLNWGKSLDRTATGFHKRGDATHSWSQPVRSIHRSDETFVYQPKVAVSLSGWACRSRCTLWKFKINRGKMRYRTCTRARLPCFDLSAMFALQLIVIYCRYEIVKAVQIDIAKSIDFTEKLFWRRGITIF